MASPPPPPQAMMYIKCTIKTLTAAGLVLAFVKGSRYVLDRYGDDPNTVKELFQTAVIPSLYVTGAVVRDILPGCFNILVEIRSLNALDGIWKSYIDGDMKKKLEKVIVTDELRSLAPDDAVNVELSLMISEEEYQKTRDYLLETGLRNDVGAASLASMATSTPSSSPPPEKSTTAAVTATLSSPPLSKRGLHETSIEGEEKNVDAKRGLHETFIEGEEKTVDAKRGLHETSIEGEEKNVYAIRGLHETLIEGEEKTLDTIAIRGLHEMSIRRLDDKLDRMSEHLGAMVNLQYKEKGMAGHLRAMVNLQHEMKGIAAELLAKHDSFENEKTDKGVIPMNGTVRILTAGGLMFTWAAGSCYLLHRYGNEPEKVIKLVTSAIIPSLFATVVFVRGILG